MLARSLLVIIQFNVTLTHCFLYPKVCHKTRNKYVWCPTLVRFWLPKEPWTASGVGAGEKKNPLIGVNTLANKSSHVTMIIQKKKMKWPQAVARRLRHVTEMPLLIHSCWWYFTRANSHSSRHSEGYMHTEGYIKVNKINLSNPEK